MYASNSDKTLVSVVPSTVEGTDIVREWEIGVEYSFPAVGYTTSSTSYTSIVYSIADVYSLGYAATEFTLSGLSTLGEDLRDESFDTEYLEEHPETKYVRHVGFAITTLSA